MTPLMPVSFFFSDLTASLRFISILRPHLDAFSSVHETTYRKRHALSLLRNTDSTSTMFAGGERLAEF